MATEVGDKPQPTWRAREESVSRRKERPAMLNDADGLNEGKTELANGFGNMKVTGQEQFW